MPRHQKPLSADMRRFAGLCLVCLGWFLSANVLPAQSLEEVQQQFIHGDYAGVVKIAGQHVAAHDYDSGWRLLLEKALLMTGQYPEAHAAALAGMGEYYE